MNTQHFIGVVTLYMAVFLTIVFLGITFGVEDKKITWAVWSYLILTMYVFAIYIFINSGQVKV